MLTLSIASMLASSMAAPRQIVRLSDPPSPTATDRVSEFAVTPDGMHAVYLSHVGAGRAVVRVAVDAGTPPLQLGTSVAPVSGLRVTPDGTYALFLWTTTVSRLRVVPVDGSAPHGILDGALGPGGNVTDYEITSDGSRVVYRADARTDESFEIFSRPIDRSAPAVSLSGPQIANGSVRSFRLSSDGTRVVYLADQEVNERFDLYSAPVDGSAPAVRLNLPRPNADVQDDFAIAADSLGVVYRSNQDVDQVVELYAVSIGGALQPSKRNGPLVAGGDVVSFALSGVSDRLIYRADQDVDDVVELYSTRGINGGTPVKLNAALVANGDVVEAELSPNGVFVVYRADQVEDELYALHSVPAVGGTALQLGPSGIGEAAFEIPAGVGRVLFVHPPEAPALWSAPLDGHQPALRIGQPLVDGAFGCEVEAVLGDGTVIYTADEHSPAHRELFRVPIDGSAAPSRLSDAMVSGPGIGAVSLAMGNTRIVYLAAREHGRSPELVAVPATGGPCLRLSPLTLGPATGTVERFAVSADGTRAAYVAEQDSDMHADLYGVSTDGAGRSVQLNHPFGGHSTDVGPLGQVAMSPDGTRVAYEVVRPWGSYFRRSLHCATGSGFRSGVLLAESFDKPADRVGLQFAFTPDSSRIVYLAVRQDSGVVGLLVRQSDGSAPAIELDADIGVWTFELSPDAEWVVYRRESQLYSVPLDQHRAPFRLDTSLGAGSVQSWRIASTGDRVVFLRHADSGTSELYSVSIAGGAPVKLNGPLPPGGRVKGELLYEGYLISPDGSRVVYRADQDEFQVFELYGVPIGGGTAVKLNENLPAGGKVDAFALAPDGVRVVYRASPDRYLHSAALDGSGSVQLTGQVGWTWDDPDNFRIGPHHVAYLDRTPTGHELWSVPLDGSTAAVRLSVSAPTWNWGVQRIELTPDGASVVYASNEIDAGVLELFVVPADGHASPRRISDGSVQPDFHVASDGRRVLYRAIEDIQGLHVAWLARGPRSSAGPSRTVAW
jgi:Tol biopolymer transport system component